MAEESKVVVSEEMEKIISYVEKLTVLELSQLVKALEERLGVSAAAPMAVAGVAAGAAAPQDKAEEKTEFDVMLMAAGEKKIGVIKEVKDRVEGAPKPVKTGVPKADADKFKAQLEQAGATVELK